MPSGVGVETSDAFGEGSRALRHGTIGEQSRSLIVQIWTNPLSILDENSFGRLGEISNIGRDRDLEFENSTLDLSELPDFVARTPHSMEWRPA
jgi:hypothetical protein